MGSGGDNLMTLAVGETVTMEIPQFDSQGNYTGEKEVQMKVVSVTSINGTGGTAQSVEYSPV